MDQATQQNAAMAEEATAATRNLQQQTEILAQLVSRFRTSREAAPAARHERKTAASPRAPAARRAAPMKATGTHGFAHAASDNSNWEEF
jgi:methyl-accepting chemotaxis protein